MPGSHRQPTPAADPIAVRPPRRPIVAVALASALVGVAALVAGSPPPAGGVGPDQASGARAGQANAAGTRARPNVIVVMTDDQTVSQFNRRYMPATLNALKRHGNGTKFTESIVSAPLCCPSRAGFMTGQYPHNSNVYDNEPGYWGLTAKTSTLYGWLQAAGYRTGHVGRFLLNYNREPAPGDPDTAEGLAPPPGVEHWFGYVGNATHYYGARFSRNGKPVQLGSGPGGYTTRAINREARAFVRRAKSDPRPFFLTVAHVAPHMTREDNLPGPCGNGRAPYPPDGKPGPFKNERLPKAPSFGEPGKADKPHWVRTLPGLGPARRRALRTGWRCALAALKPVDDGVRSLIKQLDRQNELADTAVFFTSDNGYFFGEHGIVLNKVFPYEEAIRVPLLARVPERLLGRRVRREGRPRRSSALVNNLDLTATILDLAGAAPCTSAGECRTLDGRSLRPLLSGRRPAWSRGRALLVQLGGIRDCGSPAPERGLRNFYDAARTKRRVYIELDRVNPETGTCDRPEFELYDLREDPFQLRNRAVNVAAGAVPDAIQSGLASRLNKLRNCAGIAGRDAPVAGRPFCE